MNNEDLLKHIADTAYNVGYGAKVHFSTYDIVDKAPGLISFFSMAFGVFSLYIDALSTKHLSATFVVLGIMGLYMSFYNPKKQDYFEVGVKLTNMFNELKRLYVSVKSSEESDLEVYQDRLEKIEQEFNSSCISRHILFSGWYAHYKFFWQQQIEWVDEQKSFSFLRDKIPLSLSAFVVLVVLVVLGIIVYWSDAVKAVCGC